MTFSAAVFLINILPHILGQKMKGYEQSKLGNGSIVYIKMYN